ncbi:MAG: YggS family pyridoxal phosphate-dependent enzyme [Bergeyella sp.]|nr:YggS family pyridoxal phosphate-dependent enzyme [Bergeyella sp.]
MQKIQEIIVRNFKSIQKALPSHIELVAVSKNHSVEKIGWLYSEGQRVFGENRVQELVEKEKELPKDIRWQFVGHLQTNKVKYIAPFVDRIQSVDSEKLLIEIDKQALKNGRRIKVLLQIKIAEEENKTGLAPVVAENIYAKYIAGDYCNVEICGLMGIATHTENREKIREEFTFLKNLFDDFSSKKKMKTLSMGMSEDYLLAIECGANSVRIGSVIFGER